MIFIDGNKVNNANKLHDVINRGNGNTCNNGNNGDNGNDVHNSNNVNNGYRMNT